MVEGYTALNVEGYPSSLTITLGIGSNEINFYYTADEQSYTVNYYKAIVKSDGSILTTKEKIALSDEKSSHTGEVIYSENEKEAKGEIAGYTYVMAGQERITIRTNAVNEVNLYYTANKQSYTVNYYLKDKEGNLTDKPVAEPKTDAETRTGVVIKALDEKEKKGEIAGYTYAQASVESITVSATEPNILNLYYTADEQSYTVNY